MRLGRVFGILSFQERLRLLIALQLLLLIAGVEVLLLSLVGPLLRLLDDSAAIGPGESSQRIWGLIESSRDSVILLIASVIFVRFALKVVTTVAESRFRQAVSVRLSESYYLRTLDSNAESNASVVRVNLSNLRQAADLLFDPLIRIYTESVTGLVLIGFLLYSSPTTSLLVISIAIGVCLIVGPAVLRVSSRLGRESRQFDIRVNDVVDETVSFEVETKVFNLKMFFSERFLPWNRELVRKRSRLNQIYALVPALVEFIGVSLLVAVVGFSSYFLSGGPETISTIAIFVVVAIRLIPSAGSFYSASIRLRYGLSQLPDYENNAAENANDAPADKSFMTANIEKFAMLNLKDVGHTHEGASGCLFSSVNLSVKVGETVGIFGDSGVGKSTLGLIAVGAVIPTSGLVSMTSVSGYEVQAAGVSRGYVPQLVPIIRGSLRDNIRLGRDIQHHSDLDELISRVGLEHLDVRSSYENEQLLEMSGGERQRIGIARALFGKPSLLVLDEVTSSLDPDSESEVLSLILKVSQFSSTLFITHRWALRSNFTRSYVLREGRLSEL